MRQQHRAQPLQPLPASSSSNSLSNHQSALSPAQTRKHRSNSTVARAKPDRGSLAALEAAIGAINGILGAHSKSRQKQQQKGAGDGKQQGSAAAGGAKPVPGPSKLISFSAKASGSVPVKVC
jgi:hypothetical protein